jgi:hypothetical protein
VKNALVLYNSIDLESSGLKFDNSKLPAVQNSKESMRGDMGEREGLKISLQTVSETIHGLSEAASPLSL